VTRNPRTVALDAGASRAIAALLVLIVAAGCGAAPDGSDVSSPAGSPTPTSGVATTPTRSPGGGSVDPGTIREPLRLSPGEGGSFVVHGRFPWVPSPCLASERPTLTGRFPGTLRIERADDGTLSLAVVLPFERYLEGIAEVPPSWPRASLEAQAIAARSYALATTGWAGSEGEPLGEPICATTACQVYRGTPVPADPDHERWVRAVRRTRGSMLLSDGRPAQTVYFSTSNGRTYGNEAVFGSSPLPYLRPVVERDDGASPSSRWRVRVPFRDLTRFLRADGSWPSGRAIRIARPRGDAVVFRGGGVRRSIEVDRLRDALNEWAPCLQPDRYPSTNSRGTLPLTVPSRWVTVSTDGADLVFTGRGWGHGVGMVQWGAYGKARRGLSASEILAFYYGGLRPRRAPEPGTIRVEVATGLTAVRIRPSGTSARIAGRPFPGRLVVLTGGDRLEVRVVDGSP
jgi:stage II sporulation protein D